MAGDLGSVLMGPLGQLTTGSFPSLCTAREPEGSCATWFCTEMQLRDSLFNLERLVMQILAWQSERFPIAFSFYLLLSCQAGYPYGFILSHL